MIPLDSFEKWSPLLDECAKRYLSPREFQAYQSIPGPERKSQLKALLERPIAQFSPVNEAYFRARWAEVLTLVNPGPDLTLLEVATGDADMIPQAMARTHAAGKYMTVNMNRRLNRRFRERTRDLALEIDLIEADAGEIENYLQPESVDLIAFQHAMNDVIQAILCARESIDTVEADWMETLPKMIAILQRETAQGTFEQHAKAPFLGLLRKLLKALKKGGTIAMHHYMFQLDLDWGYPPALWENLVPITREWINGLPGCKEVFWDGFDPHWWSFLRKI